MKLLDHMLILCSTFWGTSKQLSTEAIPIYTPLAIYDSFYFSSFSPVLKFLFSFGLFIIMAMPVLLPGKSHGWRSLVGCGPWGREESDMTELLHFHFSLSCMGEGNGNPLQCSSLENPRDKGAWCAAVHGVAQSRTRLKWQQQQQQQQQQQYV